MKKVLGCVLSALVSFSAFGAAAPEPDPAVWVKMVETSDGSGSFYAKKGSFVDGKNSRSLIAQQMYVHYGENKVHYYKISVSEKDCQNQYGKVVFSTLQGVKEFSSDYLKDGGSVASAIGDVICANP